MCACLVVELSCLKGRRRQQEQPQQLTIEVIDLHDEATEAIFVHLIRTDVKVGLDVRLADCLGQLELIEQSSVRLLHLGLLVQCGDVLFQQ